MTRQAGLGEAAGHGGTPHAFRKMSQELREKDKKKRKKERRQ
jgi:hypothetical protein